MSDIIMAFGYALVAAGYELKEPAKKSDLPFQKLLQELQDYVHSKEYTQLMIDELSQKRERILDMRGSLYSANFIEVVGERPYYCGYPIAEITKADTLFPSAHLFDVALVKGLPVGTIALSLEDKERVLDLLTKSKKP